MATLQGYAVIWGDICRLEDGTLETIEQYAFVTPMSAQLRFQHDARPYAHYASTAARTLRVAQDKWGMRVWADLDEANRDHRRLIQAIQAGLRGLSVRYRALAQRGPTVVQARLKEISITGHPLYPKAACWLAHEGTLPPQLEALRSGYLAVDQC